jgi:hypothetical protein
VFANRSNFLNTLQVGDQIFVNAYLIAVKAFANAGQGATAAYAAEFMGVEAVHRALARQSLGLLGNDRAFMKLLTLVAMGLVFELPVVMMILARVRVVSSAMIAAPLADVHRRSCGAGHATAGC